MQLPPLSLYVHLPWCERKCPYCDFNSHEIETIPEREYVAALLCDLDRDAHLAAGRSINTLFIGGGTPSLFSAEAIAELLQGLRQRLSFAADCEATLEANPGSAEARKFRDFRQAGITRLSLGIQSFDDDKLRALGRVHNRAQAMAAIDYARSAGFDSFNLDLMHGLPGQGRQDALADLQTAIDFAPPHLSWYQLTIEPNTVFHKRPPLLPVEDELGAIQESGEALLAQHGYQQYEVSAYSRAGAQCRHNLNYWRFGDYLALGAGAHGKVTTAEGRVLRYAKTRTPRDYLANALTTVEQRELDAQDLLGEFMLNALRLNQGFSLDQFEARTGLDRGALQPQLGELAARGLLDTAAEAVRASPLGRRFLDTVVAEFFPH
ncbi:radical SAM family heme chaperone HemW [Haliea sp. E17]|uniref:radical SAM family heme chaperone HemW n=1 Tax=Haliea sp. E17 TaxID=3401576 RepID=UPI003AAAA8AC